MFPNPIDSHPQSPPQHHQITTTTTTTTSTSEEPQHHQITTTTSEEPQNTTNTTEKEPKTTNDGGSVEVVRRPRGRPPGTKNKPKSPVSVTHQPDPCMSPYIFEVSSGSDIIAALMQFCNHRNTSLSVLSGSGSVSNVSFRLPSAPTPRIFRGCFSLLSISAIVMPSSSPIATMLTPPANSDFLGKFVISVASPQGQMIGGAVVGSLIASGPVHIVAAKLNNPLYQRLPLEVMEVETSSGLYGYVPVPIEQSLGSGSGDSGTNHAAQPTPTVVEPLSMYRLPGSDFGWPTTPRQTPPHSSHY